MVLRGAAIGMTIFIRAWNTVRYPVERGAVKMGHPVHGLQRAGGSH